MKIKYILTAAVLGAGLVSCDLDETLYTNFDATTFIKDVPTARNVLNGVYRGLSSNYLYGYYLSIIYDLPTDIAKVDGNSIVNNRDICVNAHTSSHAYVQNTWAQAYSVIYGANDFLEKTSAVKFSESQKPVIDVYRAEARSIRALMYFELVRLFGGVTIIEDTRTSRNRASTFKRNTAVEVYEYVEKELLEAAEDLPWATADSIRTDNTCAFSKAGALGILARAYITWAGYPVRDESKYDRCAEVCRTIIESGQHGLLPDYETLWRNVCNGIWDPAESLLQISFFSPTISAQSGQNCSGYIGKWNGVHVETNTSKLVRVDARYRALPTFIGSWKDPENDLRWGLSAVNYSYKGTEKVPQCVYAGKEIPFSLSMKFGAPSVYRDAYKNGLYVAKYDLMKYVPEDNQLADGNYSNAHWYLLRYSDVLLMLAESLNESAKGPSDEAYEAVNQVRRRGYGLPCDTPSADSDLPAGMSYLDFQKAVRDERAYELCFEGQRKQDLIRWGIYYETVMQTYQDLEEWRENFSGYYIAGKYTIKGRHELLPIPQRELDLMPLYTQNPGW